MSNSFYKTELRVLAIQSGVDTKSPAFDLFIKQAAEMLHHRDSLCEVMQGQLERKNATIKKVKDLVTDSKLDSMNMEEYRDALPEIADSIESILS